VAVSLDGTEPDESTPIFAILKSVQKFVLVPEDAPPRFVIPKSDYNMVTWQWTGKRHDGPRLLEKAKKELLYRQIFRWYCRKPWAVF
jgi:hypothetical protein